MLLARKKENNDYSKKVKRQSLIYMQEKSLANFWHHINISILCMHHIDNHFCLVAWLLKDVSKSWRGNKFFNESQYLKTTSITIHGCSHSAVTSTFWWSRDWWRNGYSQLLFCVNKSLTRRFTLHIDHWLIQWGNPSFDSATPRIFFIFKIA